MWNLLTKNIRIEVEREDWRGAPTSGMQGEIFGGERYEWYTGNFLKLTFRAVLGS